MSKPGQRRGWALMAVLVVLGVVAVLGGTLLSSMVRQRLQMRRNMEEQQARWLAASIARMAPVRPGDSPSATWKSSLPANAPLAQLVARIESDPSGERRIVVESPESENRRIVYSEVLVIPSSK